MRENNAVQILSSKEQGMDLLATKGEATVIVRRTIDKAL